MQWVNEGNRLQQRGMSYSREETGGRKQWRLQCQDSRGKKDQDGTSRLPGAQGRAQGGRCFI